MGLAIFTANHKTGKQTSGASETLGAYNPYLAARREWDERYGDQIVRARNWRTVAVLCTIVALVATSGVVWLSFRSRIVPFVVVTDNLGRPVASGLADQASTTDEQLKRSTVIEWVENLRLVTTDGIAQRRAIDRVYAHIASGSPAQTFISDFYRTGQPFTRAQTETVSVDVQSVLQDSEGTFEIEWLETIRDLYGAVKEKDRWKGAFSIAINPPKDERLARINPLGV
ncbi:MAG TPA: VirB8/TrbF family protein, partial [Bryobacteraceae bacterium]|nr:VirB8/TrbF family protein [Bryobacteraceae bacterium]